MGGDLLGFDDQQSSFQRPPFYSDPQISCETSFKDKLDYSLGGGTNVATAKSLEILTFVLR